MSLYQPADGIFETHVTWDDIENEFQVAFRTKARFGEKKTATNISDKKGYMSRVVFIEADWINVEAGITLPQKFAVKIPTQIPLLELSKVLQLGGDGFNEEKIKSLGKMTRECHNREVETYKLLTKFSHPDVPFTKVYGYRKFSEENPLKGYIIVDFIPNVHTVGPFRSIPMDELLSLVRGIATFAALGETLPLEDKKFAVGDEYMEICFGEVFDRESLQKKFVGLFEVFSEDQHEKVKKVIEIFQVYLSLLPKYSQLSKLLGFKAVLNHGDLWQSNMIHVLDENGKMKLKAMIDWQSTGLLSPGLDTSRIIIGCLSAEERRSRGSELLHFYHKTFVEVYGAELFTFQELQDSFNLYFPMASIIILPSMMPFINSSEFPEEEKAELKKTALVQITALLEDILTIHKLNLEKYPEFMKP
uniref:CHK domain-containing protein n=1 Tax=Caenorhabditis tropicalis TaxID=1561998 RepID=A0A1I7V1T9_9PELO